MSGVDPKNVWLEATLYRGAATNRGKGWEGTLGDLLGEVHKTVDPIEGMPEKEIKELKKQCRAFGPHTLEPGTGRAMKNVASVTALIFDFDHLTTKDAGHLLDGMADLSCVIYTSFSNGREKSRNSFRLILPIDRPLTPAEHARAYPYLRSELGADKKCDNIDRIFFLPVCPEDLLDHAAILWNQGKLTRTDSVLAEAPKPSKAKPKKRVKVRGKLPKDEIWDKLASTGKPWVLKLYKGRPFADVGERDATLHEIMGTLAFLFPKEDAENLLDLVAPSLAAMEEEDPENHHETREWARDKLERAREVHAKRAAAEDAIGAALDAQEFKEAGERYSEDEIEKYAAEVGCTVEEFQRRLIIQHSGAYYIFRDGKYLPPVSREDLPVAMIKDLAKAPVEFYYVNKSGTTIAAQPQDVLKRHSTVARSICTTLTADRSTFDPRTETFFEAAAPLRRLEPTKHPKIDEWLRLLGGSQADSLLDWVATVTFLDRPSCAVYLWGPKDGGKSLFALGLARLYEYGVPTAGKQVLQGAFNSALVGCPIVHIDEAMPQRPGYRPNTAELREQITTDRRALQRKYLPDSVLEGALRFILTANNDRLLVTREELDNEDLRAIASRFLMIEVGMEPVKYLAGLGGRAGTDKWVRGNQIAEHALWLRDTRKVKSKGRLIVEGDVERVHEKLAWSSGVNSYICEWVVKYMINPEKLGSSGKWPRHVKVGNGKIHVSPVVIAETWNSYIKNEDPPSLDQVGKAMLALSSAQVVLPAGGGKEIRAWEIEPKFVLSWARDRLVGDLSELRKTIGGPPPPDNEGGKVLQFRR